jgi:hypothetical protein
MRYLKDRFTCGFLAGILGGMSASAVNTPLYLLKLSEFRLIDFAGVLIYGHTPKTLPEIILGYLIHWGFAGFGAGVFVFLVRLIKEDNFLFKSAIYGVGVWFIVFVVTELYKMPQFKTINFPSALITLAASAAYGIVMGLLFKYLEKRFLVTD